MDTQESNYTNCPCCDGESSPYVSGAPCGECNGTGKALLEPGAGARRLQSLVDFDAAQEAAGDNQLG